MTRSKINFSSKYEYGAKRDEFAEFIDNLGNLTKGVINGAQLAAEHDAKEIAKDLNKRYADYVSGLSNYDKQKSASTKIRFNTSKYGFDVEISGPEVLYQEFGTGQLGFENPYPDVFAMRDMDYEYLEGKTILHDGKYLNDRQRKIPKWYESAIEKYEQVDTEDGKGINPEDYVWMSPKGITHGLEPGAFWYYTWDSYIPAEDEYDDDMDVTVTPKKGKYKLTGAHFKILVEDILKGKKE